MQRQPHTLSLAGWHLLLWLILVAGCAQPTAKDFCLKPASETAYKRVGFQKIQGPNKELVGFLETMKVLPRGGKKYRLCFYIYDNQMRLRGYITPMGKTYICVPGGKARYAGDYAVEDAVRQVLNFTQEIHFTGPVMN